MAIDPARVKILFLAAAEITSPAERTAYLDSECGGDAELRARVDALLAADAGGDVMPRVQEGATTMGGSFPVPSEGGLPPGRIIAGRYTLIDVLGEGGMGTVYRAEQTEPLRRYVALKLVKVGLDSRTVLNRFDAERQALAMMDHPNIARVYDAGATETGQPFFVMELVRGVTITRYCDRHRLPVRARLELFVVVCQAVQHAHQKGIIHRDLKPSNVLVTEVDGRPVPKVIDFGVAKATEFDLTDRSLAETGAIVGTPTYMSPEQADPSLDIDFRTDIYALGVLLYELLTGSPPIEANQFKRGAVLEMLRMVREIDPPKPSTKVSTAHGLPNIAATRNIDPEQLKRELRGDLDWIVMKALEKDRTRRYEMANGFAADVLRHLAHEPVLAAPPSLGYRLRKFVRRNRGSVVAIALIGLALLGGIAGTFFVLTHANRADAQAEFDAKIARERQAELDAKTARERQAKLEAEKKGAEQKAAEQKARAAANANPLAPIIGYGFHGPNGIAADAAGNVYVSDFFNSAIKKILPDGTIQIIASGVVRGNSVTVDAAGNIWVADANKSAVHKVSPAGDVTTIYPERTNDLISVAVAPSGNLYIANSHGHTVEEVTPAGAFIRFIGTGFRRPYDVVVDSAGNIYVADSESNAVEEFSPAGALIRSIAVAKPFRVAVDASGNVYVACAGDGTIRKILPNGDKVTLLAGLALPKGVAVDAAGHVYACDFDGNTVYALPPQPATTAPGR